MVRRRDRDANDARGWVLRFRISSAVEGKRGRHALRVQLLMTTLFCVLYPTLFRADTTAPMVAPTRVRLRAARENVG